MDNIKSTLKDKNKIIIFFIIVVAISLPILISQVLRQQDTRQRASGADPITFSISSSPSSITINSITEVTIKVNTNGGDIGALSFKVNYDAQKLELIPTSTQFPSKLQKIKESSATNGVYEVSMINESADPVRNSPTGTPISVLKLTFRGLSSGTSTINVSGPGSLGQIQATATGDSNFIGIVASTNSTVTVTTVTSPIVATANTAQDITSTTARIFANITKPADSTGGVQFRAGAQNIPCKDMEALSGGSQVLAGPITQSFQEDLTELSPSTPYYFCIEYTTPSSTTPIYSNVVSFETLAIISTPTPTPTKTPTPSPTSGSTATTCTLKPRGDADCDGKVDIFDFIIWKCEYATSVTPTRADFDGSGTVNYEDFEDWKSGYRDSNVPHQ